MMTLANAILEGDVNSVKQMLRYGEEVNQLDEYGFTPLIEAAIIENLPISELLLSNHANPNQQDVTGGTPLQWAVENNNIALATLLLKAGADPNSYNFAGQPVLALPLLRRQNEMKNLLLESGADLTFAQDYINTKLLGHMFELVGTAEIIDPKNEFVEVDFEGFILEVTLGIIADSLHQFQNHFAARQLRRYAGLSQFIVETMRRALQLIKYQQYRVDVNKYMRDIDALLNHDPLLIPVGYEGHAITFIKQGHIWVKCDRREDSRLYDNIMFYEVTKPQNLTPNLYKYLLFEKQTSEFINQELDELLGLKPITELKVDAQISGNCTWANVEAVIPAMFFLIMMQSNRDTQAVAYYKTLALNFFHRWRDWNKDRALNLCIQSYEQGDAIRKASKAEILAAILFQTSNQEYGKEKDRINRILSVLIKSPYEYVLKNYLQVYYYEGYSEEGKRFSELLKEHGYSPKVK